MVSRSTAVIILAYLPVLQLLRFAILAASLLSTTVLADHHLNIL